MVTSEKFIHIDGRKLARARAKLLRNQEEFAAAAGVSNGFIKKAEPKNRVPIYLSTAKKLATALGMSDDQFMREIALQRFSQFMRDRMGERAFSSPDSLIKSIADIQKIGANATHVNQMLVADLPSELDGISSRTRNAVAKALGYDDWTNLVAAYESRPVNGQAMPSELCSLSQDQQLAALALAWAPLTPEQRKSIIAEVTKGG